MAEEWDDGTELLQPATNTTPFVGDGRLYGKGRGFIPLNDNNDKCTVGGKNVSNDGSRFGNNNNNNDNSNGGWGCSGGWGFSGNHSRGRGVFLNRNDDNRDNNGIRGGIGGRENDRDDDNNEDTDNKAFRSSNRDRYNEHNGGDGDYRSRGRGGRSVGRGENRGGFRNREEDGAAGLDCFGGSSGDFGKNIDGDNNDSKEFKGSGEPDYRPRGRRGGSREDFTNSDKDGDGKSNGLGKKFNSDRESSGFGKKFNSDGDDDSKPSHGGFGEGRGDGGAGSRERSDRNNGKDENGQNRVKREPVTYIPPEMTMDDDELFNGVDVGLNFAKYDEIQATATGENFTGPKEDFKVMGLRNLIIDNIVKSGYTKPTPVQKYAIPIIMNGRDLMACAQTGSGKTAAFMVPIINNLLENPSELKLIAGGCEPHCVVVSPTRELAIQIGRQACKFAKDSIIKCCVIYGGVATMYQGNQVANGCHILVATPGRLLHFIDTRRVSFASIRYVVLDEADRMLDMGFLESIQKMMGHETMVAKGVRQTLMFSATFREDVQLVARDFLDNYLFLTVGIVGAACSDVEQLFYEVTKKEKRPKLMELLKNDTGNPIPRTIIFVETKKNADFLALFLADSKIPATSIHGDRMQQQREEALRDFISGKMPVLVATSVAARGLDIKDVAHVINYDMPKGIDEYVHRIGRTGRVGNRGKATSFFNFETDSGIVNDLISVLKSSSEQSVPNWLSGSGEANFATGDGDKFGGHDVRNGNDASKAEPDEEW